MPVMQRPAAAGVHRVMQRPAAAGVNMGKGKGQGKGKDQGALDKGKGKGKGKGKDQGAGERFTLLVIVDDDNGTKDDIELHKIAPSDTIGTIQGMVRAMWGVGVVRLHEGLSGPTLPATATLQSLGIAEGRLLYGNECEE
jgi:hypothetical protein